MNTLKLLVILVLLFFVIRWLIADVREGYCGGCTRENFNGERGCDALIAPKGTLGYETNLTATGLCGWNNTVSTDTMDGETGNWAPESLKGKPRVYKYPHYYGYGTGSGFHYGEPYYVRTVDY